MENINRKYNELARSALFAGLVNCEFESDVSIKIDKSEILEAFERSGSILRSNTGDQQYKMIAEVIFETCIRLTRCLFYPIDARVIVLNGNEYTINAGQQLKVLHTNLEELDKLGN